MNWHDRFIAFDTETTGFSEKARILELGIVEFQDGKVVSEWNTLFLPPDLDPQDPDTLRALEINQIKIAELQDKRAFEAHGQEILDLLAGSGVWVAHNADFDVRMLKQEFARIGDLALPEALVLDTCSLDYHMNPEAGVHKLGHVAQRWGVQPTGAHRAAADATACGQIFFEMVRSGKIPGGFNACARLQQEAATAWKSKRRKRY